MITQRKKILFITPRLPYPPISGGTIKTYKMIEYLADEYDLTLAVLVEADSAKWLEEFRRKVGLQRGIISVPHTIKKRNMINCLISFLIATPLSIYRNQNRIFFAKIGAIAANFDCILFDHFITYQFVPIQFRAVAIYHAHNAEYVMWEDAAKVEQKLIKKIVLRIESARIRNYEYKIGVTIPKIIAAPNDQLALQRLGISTRFYKTYHLGIEEIAECLLNNEQREPSLLYVGTLSWEANKDGLEWFLAEVYPKISLQSRPVKLYIIGKGLSQPEVNRLKNNPSINYMGFVNDLHAYYQKCSIFIAPIRFGSGIKVKVISAMAQGLPVVTTSVGIEGLVVENKRECIIADTPDAMAEAINTLMRDSKLRSELSSNALDLCRREYSWPVVNARLKESIDD